ncbi:Fpg/Nei family DNA glycosylase [Propionibacterium freudenreichii]|uniref:Fpg/Nei family DNA glycosylase n=1 Tax=Propionibacterium freudenreichii TaxID=1744 RepID=UPI000660318F|nr:DNA-formamidopyrimidine glycosylase family protein [Propionibacterium freudenreichii]WFF31024.1 Fpg/Nei family DNA glycosylase [Propionibacterium freudenreichii]
MPELPQVEALADFLRTDLVGSVIERLEVGAISALKTFDPPPDALVGRTVTAINRFGKHLDVDAGGLHLVFHLARAGWLVWREKVPSTVIKPGKSRIALRVRLQGGAGFDLTEAGTQRKLAVWIVHDPQQVPSIASLGPDPMAPGFMPAVFRQILADAGRAQLKGILRDQHVIAGIGNAYSDEILHDARLSPFKPAANLTDDEVERLYAAIRDGLAAATERARGLAARDIKADKRAQLRIHGHAGDPCPVCGTPIASVNFADSSLQYCPVCQTGGKKLADRRMSKLLK